MNGKGVIFSEIGGSGRRSCPPPAKDHIFSKRSARLLSQTDCLRRGVGHHHALLLYRLNFASSRSQRAFPAIGSVFDEYRHRPHLHYRRQRGWEPDDRVITSSPTLIRLLVGSLAEVSSEIAIRLALEPELTSRLWRIHRKLAISF